MICPYCDEDCSEVAGAEGLYYCKPCNAYVEDETWDDDPPPKQFKTKVRPISDTRYS